MKKIYFSGLTALLLFFGSAKTNAQYASSGVGKYKNQIYWLNWQKSAGTTGLLTTPTTYNGTSGATIVNGDYVWTIIPNKLRVYGTLGNITGNTITATVGTGSYSAGFKNMYNLNGLVGIQTSAGTGIIGSLTLLLQTSIDGTNWTTVNPNGAGIVVADAESINGAESIQATTSYSSGSNGWELIDYNPGDYTGAAASSQYTINIANSGGNSTFKATNTGANADQQESTVLFARGVNQLTNVTMHGGGVQIFSFGFVIPFDYGDAPSSYGDASHLIQQFIPSATQSSNILAAGDHLAATYGYLNYITSSSVWLGNNKPDADPGSYYSADAKGDDIHDANGGTTGVTNDEDAIAVPTDLDVNNVKLGYPISFTASNTGFNTAFVSAWLDKDRNNVFDYTDALTFSGADGSAVLPGSVATLSSSWPTTLTAGYYYARFRISSGFSSFAAFSADETATGAAADGEVEDYRIHVQGYTVSGSVVNDGNGVAGGVTGSELGTVGGSPLYAYLTDANGVILQTTTVNSTTGTYSFTDLNAGDYRVYVSTVSNLPVGGTASTTLPTGWSNSAQSSESVSATSAVTNTAGTSGYSAISIATGAGVNTSVAVAQGLNQTPTSTTGNVIVPNNDSHVIGGVLTDFPIPALQGSDPEDQSTTGSLSGKTIIIQTLPTSGTLSYNGSPVTAGQTITNYDTDKLTFTSASGYSQPSFTFSYVDQADAVSTPSTFTIIIPFNLPVVLQQFNGINQNGAILLKWSTASEINAQSFEVQRSNDGGKTWSAIGTVNAVGNSTTVQQYSFTDIAPLAANQYRLNMIDADGSSEISKLIVAVNLGQNATSFKVIPNPITGNGHGKILLNAPLETKSELRIVDIAGRTVKTYPVAAGAQTVEFGTDGLAKGIYIVTLLTTNGVQHDKILIN